MPGFRIPCKVDSGALAVLVPKGGPPLNVCLKCPANDGSWSTFPPQLNCAATRVLWRLPPSRDGLAAIDSRRQAAAPKRTWFLGSRGQETGRISRVGTLRLPL